ncbi:MAG: beta galactosidase jelly roll domain-containing protein [Clostridia bacterium]|nr:beta galactosidase jelly roll domain-containing protein [Clostridia bacterium]
MDNTFFFHHGWRFHLANVFPLRDAMERCRDGRGRLFYAPDYDDQTWETVSLPHTFNDGDLFSVPIEDAGSGQRRTVAFYRNRLDLSEEQRSMRVFLSFEGVRQTCYVWVNGHMAGYHENGVGPFGFDLTPFLSADGKNGIAIATDNTSTRNIPFCVAETPNHPLAEPGAFLFPQEASVPDRAAGVGFQWNCNDFNPVVGGLSQPVRIHLKRDVHLTLPLYANLRTHGTYIWADNFDLQAGAADIFVQAEIKNLSNRPVLAKVQAEIADIRGEIKAVFGSREITVPPLREFGHVLSVVPEDAYRYDAREERFCPVSEEEAAPTDIRSRDTCTLLCRARVSGLRFWEPAYPKLYTVLVRLFSDGELSDTERIETGFRQTGYDSDAGVTINGHPVFLRGYAQRASNEWAASGIAPQWMHDQDARWIRESNANHIRFMHVAGSPSDLRAFDRYGVVCTQPAGDKEKETFGRQWDQRVELMRDVILAYRNHPSVFFWEAGNNSISAEHMREMRLLKEALDPHGGRWMGCRTLNTEEVAAESEYVGTMLNRHAARFLSLHGPVTETEYLREEAPRRVWDDFSPPDYDYKNRYLGKGGKKQKGLDFYDLTSEDLAMAAARGYAEFFHDRMGGGSGKNYYSACAALCWTDSAQHGRQSYSENGRMSGRVDAIRVKKQNYDVFRVLQSAVPELKILGHWNYPPVSEETYLYEEKRFNGVYWEGTGRYARRDARHKTVHCAASYPIARVRLYVNGKPAGECAKPENSFIFSFPDVDVTQSGFVEAIGFGLDGRELARDRLETAGPPARLLLSPHTAPGGLRANGSDLAYVDVDVTDSEGRTVPLCDLRIDFALNGAGVFLGGYNSGRFEGNGRHDNVIHQPFVFAECGKNRVLIRAGKEPGIIELTASARGLAPVKTEIPVVPAETSPLSLACFARMEEEPAGLPGREQNNIPSVPEMDALKYVPDRENYCKILVNGQEPDFRNVRAVNKNGSVWGNVLCILERMHGMASDRMDWSWQPKDQRLVLRSGGHTVEARVGTTHLLVDGRENLMDGAPYLTDEGILVMEVNAIAGYVQGAAVQYDDKIGALRISL